MVLLQGSIITPPVLATKQQQHLRQAYKLEDFAVTAITQEKALSTPPFPSPPN